MKSIKVRKVISIGLLIASMSLLGLSAFADGNLQNNNLNLDTNRLNSGTTSNSAAPAEDIQGLFQPKPMQQLKDVQKNQQAAYKTSEQSLFTDGKRLNIDTTSTQRALFQTVSVPTAQNRTAATPTVSTSPSIFSAPLSALTGLAGMVGSFLVGREKP